MYETIVLETVYSLFSYKVKPDQVITKYKRKTIPTPADPG